MTNKQNRPGPLFRRLLSVLLAVSMLSGIAALAAGEGAEKGAEALAWAREYGVLDNAVAEKSSVTRAEAIAALWRMAGTPGVKTTDTFSDVAGGSDYEEAVRWAAERGITNGSGDGMFSPEKACTRAELLTLLYRYMGSPTLPGTPAGFSDVAEGSWYAPAARWAELAGVTEAGGRLHPEENCAGSELLSFFYQTKLYRETASPEHLESVVPVTWDVSADHLSIESAEARRFYDDVRAGKYPSVEELLADPVVKQLDAFSGYYKGVYGSTTDINTPEREALRNEIKAAFLATGSARAVTGEDGKTSYVYDGPVQSGYQLELVLGLPATGKSTLVTDPDSAEMGAFVLDVDVIKAMLPEYIESHGCAADSVHFEGFAMMQDAMQTFLTGERKGDNLILPIVSTDLEALMEDYIRPFEEAGYNVHAKFCPGQPNESASRVFMRELAGGQVITSGLVLSFGMKPEEVYQELAPKQNAKGEAYGLGVMSFDAAPARQEGTLQEKVEALAAPYYSKGTAVALKNPETGRHYTDHGIAHEKMVVEKSLVVAEAIEKAVAAKALGAGADAGRVIMTAPAGRDVLMAAAVFHDTGMSGGYALTDEKDAQGLFVLHAIEETDFAGIRGNHALNSGLYVLVNRAGLRDAGYTDAEIDRMAALCVAHSKSTSGVRDLNSSADWDACFDRLDSVAAAWNRDHAENTVTFDRKTLTPQLGLLAAETLALRLGDVSRDSGPDAIAHSGEVVHVEKDSVDSHGGSVAAETANAVITIGENKDPVTGEKDRQVHAGEQNIVGNLCYYAPETGRLTHEIVISDACFAPCCTQEAVNDHLGELYSARDEVFDVKLTFKDALPEAGAEFFRTSWESYRDKAAESYPNVRLLLPWSGAAALAPAA